MEKIINFIKENRVIAIIIGFFISMLGIDLGFRINHNMIIRYVVIIGISSLGLLLILVGFDVFYSKNPIIALRRCIIYIIIVDIIFCFWIIFMKTSNPYIWVLFSMASSIVYNIFILILRKEK